MKLRLSELLYNSGVGAIVRHEDNTLYVVKDIRRWKWDGSSLDDGPPSDHELKYINQISRHPKINNHRLIKPPVTAGKNDGNSFITAEKFPKWRSCTKCGLLHKGFETHQCSAEQCRGSLKQVQWVLVHRLGYLADVDWHYMAHGKNKKCPRNSRDKAYLQLIQKDGNQIVKCKKCNDQGWEKMAHFGMKTWQQPWVTLPAEEGSKDIMAEIMQIGESRLYVPERHRALVIPPESRIPRDTVVDRLYRTTEDQRKIDRTHSDLDRKSTMQTIASEYGCRVEEISEALQKIENGYPLYGKHLLPQHNIWFEEYKALRNPIPDIKENEDFVTRHKTEEWNDLKNCSNEQLGRIVSLVNCLVSVERLRMISIFTGFKREALQHVPKEHHQTRQARLVPPDIVGKCGHLPAIELYGEGIFFALNETILSEWTKQIDELRGNDSPLDRFLNHVHHVQNNYDEVAPTPKFILCHSLSHLIIRQLERNCGYSSSSIQERIYCEQGGQMMSGILIFIAVPDRHGSLGGLMQFAEPKKFYRLFSSALESAQWCSFDPVCSSTEDGKLEHLNGAACHACLMIPESSCCCGNRYLDRNLIKGNGGNLPPLMEMGGL